jgi:hypothetical protein
VALEGVVHYTLQQLGSTILEIQSGSVACHPAVDQSLSALAAEIHFAAVLESPQSYSADPGNRSFVQSIGQNLTALVEAVESWVAMPHSDEH